MAEQPRDRSPAELLNDYLNHIASRHGIPKEMADIRFKIRSIQRRLRVGYLRRSKQVDLRNPQSQPSAPAPPKPPVFIR